MATKKTNGSSGTQLSESFKNEVDSYEKSFKTIERFIDGVRAKPGMYIIKHVQRNLPKCNGSDFIGKISV